MAWTKLADVGQLPAGALIEAEHAGQFYAICNVAGEVRALGGVCPHQGGPLGEGALSGEIITCPWHMWEFHSGTGVCTLNYRLKIPTYPVRVEGSDILVEIA